MKLKSKIFSVLLASAIILTASIPLAACQDTPDEDPNLIDVQDVVTVEGGQIKGYAVENDEEILSFKGIPYAAPPIGQNRWKRPQPVESWEGVKDCKEFGNSAMQGAQEVQEGSRDTEEFLVSNKNYSEDCLTLNVWAKGGKTSKNKPVLVYVHGGAWVAGGSSCEVYDGTSTAKEDVIFVSINYRLGIFGWFANDELIAEDEEGSAGNYGLMDIIKSLEWVRDNISAFGGDGNNITLMGQSAGSNLVQTVLTSPKAQGLIKNLVTNSYNSFNSVPASVEARANACKSFGSLSELRELSAQELMDKFLGNIGLVFATLGVCNDGVYVDKSFKEGLEAGRGSTVNVMSGMVWDNEENLNNDAQFAGKKVDIMTTGEVLMADLTQIAKARVEGNASGKTYLFDFAHPLSGPDKEQFGAFHTADIPYFLNYRTPLRAEYWTDQDILMGQIASLYLTNFCKTGDPNGNDLPVWQANSGNYSYMLLLPNCQMKTLSADQIAAYEAT